MNIQNLAGQVLGQYELQSLLGMGGMGVVYRGVQLNLERTVAIKVLTPSLAAERGYLDRFYQEAKTAAALEHAHIGPVYDYGVQGEISYVVMRFLTGGTLADRMKQRDQQERPLPSVGEVARMLVQLGSALDYAHGRGVIHRDIKPSNIMFDDQGAAYLVDFGIAKLMESTTSLTASNTPIGTPAYMPPEQWRSEPLTPAADQYALAVTAYQVLTDTLPFQTTTPYALLHAHLHEDPVPITDKRRDLPLVLADTLAKAMSKSPADRYPSAGAFAAAFQEAAADQMGEATNFFTTPVKLRSTPRPGSLPAPISGPISSASRSGAQLVSTASDEDLVTIHQRTPLRLKLVVVGVVVALLAVIGVLAALWLGGGDGDSSSLLGNPQTQTRVAAALSDFSTREALRATEDLQTAEARGQQAGRATAEAENMTALAARDATQTAAAMADAATAEFVAGATQAALDATATQDAGDRRATFEAFNAEQTQAAAEQAEARQTQSAAQTQAAVSERATATAQAAQATADARATATRSAADALATQTALDARATQIALDSAALNATDAAATQAAFSRMATADARTATAQAARAQATAAALNATATRAADIVNTTATYEAAATEIMLMATTAQEAREQLGTRQALGQTATADAQTATFIARITDTPTVTPTPTLTPTATVTPTATPSPSPTPAAQPDLRMVYDESRFVITNVSERDLNISGLALMADGRPDVIFPVALWQELSAGNPARMEPGTCFSLSTGAVSASDAPPPAAQCRRLMGYVESPAPSRHFWLGGESFSLVRIITDDLLGEEVARVPVYTCEAAAGECDFALPEPVTCPGFLPSVLRVGEVARVVPRLTVNVYAGADDSGEVLAELPAESRLTILDGPRCADGTLWWQVSAVTGDAGDEITGWAAEGRDTRYWLVPATE